MSRLLSEQEFQHKMSHLPDEMTPDRDLWSGIERAIQQPSRPPLLQTVKSQKALLPVSWAASIAVSVVASWLIFSPAQTRTELQSDAVATMQSRFQQEQRIMLVSLGHF